MKLLSGLEVIYTAAHGGFAKAAVPLGGGAAVYEQLLTEWARSKPFPVHTITPAILGSNAPTAADIVGFGELAYARFSRAFGAATTAEILKHDPNKTAVLINDVSEGPDFETLAKAGFRLFTIYHVDVLNYVMAIYGKSFVSPRTAAALYAKIPKLLRPAMLQLVFDKQEAGVRHSRKLILPSAGMADVMLNTYPWLSREKCVPTPWGVNLSQFDEASVETEAHKLRGELDIPFGAKVLLTLSRISPEKGQDTLLQALSEWNPPQETWLLICGAPAFMMGRRFFEKLQHLSSRVKHVKVRFPGYVTGLRKQAFFRLADLYVFPSRHESYGLTMVEAMAASLPIVCLDHLGAREVMRPEFGEMVTEPKMLDAIRKLLSNPAQAKRCGDAGRLYAQQHSFQSTAAQLAELIRTTT